MDRHKKRVAEDGVYLKNDSFSKVIAHFGNTPRNELKKVRYGRKRLDIIYPSS